MRMNCFLFTAYWIKKNKMCTFRYPTGNEALYY